MYAVHLVKTGGSVRTQGTSGRGPLDRTRVLDAGIAHADRSGLDTLSMRSLAADLGVVPMALYKHVRDKDDLIGGMVDLLVAEYASPPAGLTWRSAVRSRILIARSTLAEHPWLREAIQSRTQPTPHVLGHMNAVAGDFISGGVSVDLTHYAMHALGHRIWGFTPEAFADPAPAAPDAGASSAEQEAAMQAMAQQFPYVTAIAMDAATRNPSGACDAQSEFEFALDLLLDAVEQLQAAGWTSRPSPSD